ncbi:hypothetical protein CAL7716_064740 [Calothrix sp. PCC 7716]|nr:hypothetical protein CAL7716_064740 [Calothrix sp. PCC 7716]
MSSYTLEYLRKTNKRISEVAYKGKTLQAFNQELLVCRIFSLSVVYPAIKAHQRRIRFVVSAAHTMEQIDTTVNILHELGLKYGVINHAIVAT